MERNTTIVVALAVVVTCSCIGGYVMLSPYTNPYTNSDITNNSTNANGTPYYLSEINTIEKPDDFKLVVRELQSGYIDVCDLNENYYLQPDFYEDSWQIGKRYYDEHDYSRWVVYGHGAYPANPHIVFKTDKVDEWIRFCTFYRTGWGTETYQGLKLVPSYSDYFDVKIEPDMFLLSPTFPVIKKDWVHKLNITVRIKQSPPKGTYTIPVMAQVPPMEQSREWFWEVFKRDISPEQYYMLEECKRQQEEGGMNLECEEWVQTGRRNKYVTTGNIQVGPRLTITIDVV